MRRIFFPYLIAGITVLIFTACSKNPEKVLVENEGLWNVDRFYYAIYTDDSLVYESNSTNQGTMEFREDGTGTTIWGSTTPRVFEWSYDEDLEEMHLTEGSMGNTYRVIESTKDKQFWSGEYGQTSLEGTYRREYELELSLIE